MQGFEITRRRNSAGRLVALSLLCLLMTACASQSPGRHGNRTFQQTSVDGPGDLALLVSGRSEAPRNLPKSRSGNRSAYEVFGKTYRVMDSARGYQEQGGASWYGSKFHGRKTSSGETYSMYDMTAAHKSLPLPTFVRVTNLENNQTIIVKVNDRGPFHPGRIIDLSYAAAARIGMLEKGTAQVEVTAISEHIPANRVARNRAAATPDVPASVNVTSHSQLTAAKAQVSSPGVAAGEQAARIVQVGAFSQVGNAQSMREKVDEAMQIRAAYIVPPSQSVYYKVRFRVAASTSLYDVFDQLERFGINNYRVIE